MLTTNHLHLFKISQSPINCIHSHTPFILSYLLLTTLILLSQSHNVQLAYQNKYLPNGEPTIPTHSNFLKGRRRVMWCGHDPGVCLDPVKNPWGGSTCCFQRYCKDTRNDPNHCGVCGRVCGFGWACCGGKCVDTRNDRLHCGACFEVCTGGDRSCSYSMCDYGG